MAQVKIPREHKDHATQLKLKGHIWEFQRGRKQKQRLNARITVAEQFALLSEHGFNISKFRNALRKKDIASSQLMKQLLAECFPLREIPQDDKVRLAITKIVNIMRHKYYWELAENRLAAKSNQIIYKKLRIPDEKEINAISVIGNKLDILERNGFDVDKFIQNLTKNSAHYAKQGSYSKWMGQLMAKCNPEKPTIEQKGKIKNALEAIQEVFSLSLKVRKRRADYYDPNAAKLKSGFKRSVNKD